MLQLDQNLSFVRVSHEDAVSVADLNVTADEKEIVEPGSPVLQKRSGLRRILLRGLDDLGRRIRRLHLRRRDDLLWTPARTGHPGSRINRSRGRVLRRTKIGRASCRERV